MPDSDKSRKSLKYLTIAAIVLLVLIAVPYIVVEIARSAAERAAARYAAGVRFQLSGVQFNSHDYVTLTFRPTPDSAPNVYAADWSLSQWKVISTVGMYPSHPIDVDIFVLGGQGFTEGPSFGGEENSFPPSNWEFDASKWETGQSGSAPLKADRPEIDPCVP